MSWKYGFETPFKSDVYFVNTRQFTNQKWGTSNPIMVRDADYGAVRVRGFGTYAFRVKDAFVFMQQLSGTHSSFSTRDISDYIRSMLVMGISDAIGESGHPRARHGRQPHGDERRGQKIALPTALKRWGWS